MKNLSKLTLAQVLNEWSKVKESVEVIGKEIDKRLGIIETESITKRKSPKREYENLKTK